MSKNNKKFPMLDAIALRPVQEVKPEEAAYTYATIVASPPSSTGEERPLRFFGPVHVKTEDNGRIQYFSCKGLESVDHLHERVMEYALINKYDNVKDLNNSHNVKKNKGNWYSLVKAYDKSDNDGLWSKVVQQAFTETLYHERALVFIDGNNDDEELLKFFSYIEELSLEDIIKHNEILVNYLTAYQYREENPDNFKEASETVYTIK